MPTATLTSKGQITIPSEVRTLLGLKTGDRIDFIVEPGGRVTLAPRRARFEDLRGIFRRPGQRALSIAEMDSGIEKAVLERWERHNRTRKG